MQSRGSAYELRRLAVGSFDLIFDGSVIGSVVREVTATGQEKAWHAELLEDLAAKERPSPFSAIEHSFRSLGAVTDWLGGGPIIDEHRPD